MLTNAGCAPPLGLPWIELGISLAQEAIAVPNGGVLFEVAGLVGGLVALASLAIMMVEDMDQPPAN